MRSAVRFENVTFRYPGSGPAVLERVSLHIPEGAFVLVTGATGAGKSTLIRAMNGLVPHFSGGELSGRVHVGGRDTLVYPPRSLADVVAFVPQDPGASFVLDQVEDELVYAMENLHVPPATMRRRVEEALDLLGIERLRARSVRSLSGGERQRVAIAAALTAGPRLLLLDEPTSQLDPQGAEDVLAALQRLVHDLGMTVVLAEHRLERVAGFADLAAGCLGHGRVILGEPAEVLEACELGPPVTRLGHLAGWSPPPLTVREARSRAPSLGGPPLSPREAASRTEPLVRVRELVAAYEREVVLKNVSLELRRGEVVALLGRNGAGKSTLLRCIAGVHHPGRGVVEVGGRAPEPGTDVGLCPQEPDSILFEDSVAAEVETTIRWRSGEARGRPGEAPAAGYLGGLGIEDLASRHPRDLSAGQRLLVATAAIAATGAPVLLLDEPTRGLDHDSKERLSGFLRSFTAEGGCVMFATHDVELVAELGARVVMLAGGELIADGSAADVLGDSAVFAPQMTRVFGRGWLTPEQVAAALVGEPEAVS